MVDHIQDGKKAIIEKVVYALEMKCNFDQLVEKE